MKTRPPVVPGEPLEAGTPIRALRAWLNHLVDLWKRGQLIVGGSGLELLDLPSGRHLRCVDQGKGGFWIKLTGTSVAGAYDWTLQEEAASGGFTDGTESGTTADDPAFELNLNSDITTPKIVRAWRDVAFDSVRFQADTC